MDITPSAPAPAAMAGVIVEGAAGAATTAAQTVVNTVTPNVTSVPVTANPGIALTNPTTPIAVIPKQGWWASKSTGGKVVTVLGVIITLGAITAPWWWPKVFPKKQNQGNNGETNNGNTNQNAGNYDGSQNIAPSAPLPEIVYTPDMLPNNGVNCGPVHQQFHGDYDFMKSEGKWLIISKKNVQNPANANKFPTWGIITSQGLIEKLNERYPA